MTQKKEVTYKTLRWGPCVVQFKILDEVRNKLLTESKKSTESYGHRLAGHLSKEVKLNSNTSYRIYGVIFKKQENLTHLIIMVDCSLL